MKKINLTLIYFVIGLLCMTTIHRELYANHNHPKIVFEPDHFHLNKEELSKNTNYNLKFINEGSDNLIISAYTVMATSGAEGVAGIKLLGSRTEYKPGESGEFEIAFPENFTPEENILIVIESNDPDYPKYIVPIVFGEDNEH